MKQDLSESEIRHAKTWLETPGVDGKNFDRICYALLKIGQLFADKLAIEARQKQANRR
jgi:hypothetical protein